MKLLLLLTLLLAIQTQLFPNIIWIYWNNGQSSLDQLGLACLTRIKQINPSWDIRVLSDSSIKQWLSEIQITELNNIKSTSKIKFTVQGYSYFLRLILLKKYGGVWLDTHTVMLQNLDWIQNLQQNSEVINKMGKKPEAFVFFKNDKTQMGFYDSYQQKGITLYPTISMQVNLIASVIQSPYIDQLLKELKRFYFSGQQYFSKIKQELSFNQEYTQYWTMELANTIIRYKQLRKYQQGKQKIQLTLQQSFFKVWSISRVKGPFYLSLQLQGNTNVNSLFRNIDQTYNKPKYLIKLHHFQQRQTVSHYLITQNYKVDYFTRKYNEFIYDYGQKYLPQNLQCLYKPFVFQDSIVNRYIMQGSSSAYFSSKRVYKNNQLPWICKHTFLQSIYNHKNSILQFLTFIFYTLILIQFLIEATLKINSLGILLKQQRLSEINKEAVKQNLHSFSVLAYVIVLQYYYLQAELFMWFYGSLYSYFLIILYLAVIFLVLSYFQLSRNGFYEYTVTLHIFVMVILLVMFLQLFVAQLLGIWNSTSPLFHFQTLVKMNKQNMKQIIKGFCKLLLLYIIGKCYFLIKRCSKKLKQMMQQLLILKWCRKKLRAILKLTNQKYVLNLNEAITNQTLQEQEHSFVSGMQHHQQHSSS